MPAIWDGYSYGRRWTMTAETAIRVKQIFPALRYQDPAAAIEWMVDVLGMEKYAIFKDEGNIVHAELKFGDVFIGLGPARGEGIFGGPVSNEGPYVAMDGVDSLYEKVKAKGADVVMDVQDTDYGSRNFSLRDPEGRIWSFGTYVHWPEPNFD
jgi:uncharacterized glyoxalase superfamily protein PhnB